MHQRISYSSWGAQRICVILILYLVLFSGESNLSQQGMAKSCNIWWPDPGLPAMGHLSHRVPQLCWGTDLQFWLRLCVTSRWWTVYVQDHLNLDLYLNRCQWRRELKILVCGSQRICLFLGLKEGQFLHRSCRASEGGCRRADVFIYISVWPCPHPWLCLHSRRVLLALWYRYRPCSLYKPLSFTRVSNTTCHRSHHQFCFLFDFPPSFQGHKRNSFSEELTNQHYTENCSSQQLGWSLRNRISKFPEQYRGSFQTPEGNFMFPWTDLILLHHFPPGFWTAGFSAPLHQLVPSDGCWHIMCNSFFTLEVSTSGR